MADRRTLLITGGNTGLGLEAVKALYKSSTAYDILLGSRSLQNAHDAIASVQSEVPQSASSLTPIQVDISDDNSITKAYEEVASSKGRVDILINNAGTCNTSSNPLRLVCGHTAICSKCLPYSALICKTVRSKARRSKCSFESQTQV